MDNTTINITARQSFATLRLLHSDSVLENIIILLWIFIMYMLYSCARQEVVNLTEEEDPTDEETSNTEPRTSDDNENT